MAQYDEKVRRRVLIFAVCLVLIPSKVLGQEAADDALAIAVEHLRHGGDVRAIQQYKMPKFTVVVGAGDEVNAYAEVSTHTIRVTRALINVMSQGELVFVIAHEIGHLQDDDCQARGAAHHLSGMALKRMCESAADQIGMQYILAAGYTPFEAAGVMGKLLMVHPDQGSILGIMVGRFLSDHPVDVDRIRQLAVYAELACKERPEMCDH